MFKLNRWTEFNIEGISIIEMKVLQRTAQIFKENENIEAAYSL
jgi:hypothetical protein